MSEEKQGPNPEEMGLVKDIDKAQEIVEAEQKLHPVKDHRGEQEWVRSTEISDLVGMPPEELWKKSFPLLKKEEEKIECYLVNMYPLFKEDRISDPSDPRAEKKHLDKDMGWNYTFYKDDIPWKGVEGKSSNYLIHPEDIWIPANYATRIIELVKSGKIKR